MRRLNAELGRLPRGRYNPTLKHYLAEQVLAERAGQEPRARLDTRTHDFAVGWNRRTRAALEASGAHLVGDIGDLSVTASSRALPHSIEPPERPALLDAASCALEGLERLARRRARRVRALGGDPAGDGGAAPSAARASWATAPDPVRAAVADLADVCRVAIADHERIQSLRA